MNRSNFRREPGRKLARYALAGAAALAPASGAVIQVNTSTPPGATAQWIDFDGDSTNDFRVYIDTGGVYATLPAGAFVATTGGVAALGYDTAIGPGSAWSQPAAAGLLAGKSNGTTNGAWPFTQNGRAFAGLQFTGSDGQTHYAWADISASPQFYTMPASFYVHAFAYETDANTAITTPIPEPSSLALMALGAAGVLALKRRKRA